MATLNAHEIQPNSDKRNELLIVLDYLLHHTSDEKHATSQTAIVKYAKDFVPGFYCTSILEQEQRWSMRFPHPVVNVYDYQIDNRLDILKFDQMTEAWLDFIIDCRRRIPHTHDIVIGAMADDQIYNYIEEYFNGTLSREQFWALAKFKRPTHQICFCTQRALQCMTFHSTCPE